MSFFIFYLCLTIHKRHFFAVIWLPWGQLWPITLRGEIGVLENFTNFTAKHLCQSFFFNKPAGLRRTTLLEKRVWHMCFPVNFMKFLRAPFCRAPPNDCFYTLLSFLESHTFHCEPCNKVFSVNPVERLAVFKPVTLTCARNILIYVYCFSVKCTI